jgi:L-ascorbate metabolism protein UlaG (beta-lactamase superfamily)
MLITKYGHACLLVEEGEARLLIDPGSFSDGFQSLTGLTAVLITHSHGDHLTIENLGPLVTQNPGITIVADEVSAEKLSEAGLDAQTVAEGDELKLGGVTIGVIGREHAEIHPEVPTPPNVGYLIGGRFFHPGDAFTDPGTDVDILALPAGGPWMKLSEAIEYLRAIKPSVAVPIHEAVLAKSEIHYQHFRRFGDEQGTRFEDLATGAPADL